MKLYATTINENGSKVSKGANEKLVIGLNKGNRNVATIDFTEDSIKIWYEGNHYWNTELQGKKQKLQGDNISNDAEGITYGDHLEDIK